MKLLQRMYEAVVHWGDPVPAEHAQAVLALHDLRKEVDRWTA